MTSISKLGGSLLAALLAVLLVADAHAQEGAPGSGAPAAAPVARAPGPNGNDTVPAEAAKPILLDRNTVLAAVNNEVVTIRDVMLEWRLKNRKTPSTTAATGPTKDEVEKLKKDIVMDRLWVAKAKEHPLYGEIVTQRVIDDQAKEEHMFGTLFDDPTVPPEERALMRAKAEAFIAAQIMLQNDPKYRRCLHARPVEIRQFYDANPERHRIPTRVTLGKVQLSREHCKELFGEPAEVLIEKVRFRAIELSSLEAAAKELAPGSFQKDPTEYDIEHDTNLLDDVREFAKSAPGGALSAPIAGKSSLMLFTVLTRKEGEDWTFDKAAPGIRKLLEAKKAEWRMGEFFVFEILLSREAFYWPPDLFDDEIKQFIPTAVRKPSGAANAPAAGR